MNKAQMKFLSKVVSGLFIIIMVAKWAWEATLPASVIALYGAFIFGTLVKVMIPFIRKIQEGKIQHFEAKYLWGIILTFLYTIPINMTLISAVDISNSSWKAAALIGLLIGIGASWGTEEFFRYFRLFKSIYKEMEKAAAVTLLPSPDNNNVTIDWTVTPNGNAIIDSDRPIALYSGTQPVEAEEEKEPTKESERKDVNPT